MRIGSTKGMGLVSQQAWIQQGTLKDNVLMGQPFRFDRYTQALYASALSDDIQVSFFKLSPHGF